MARSGLVWQNQKNIMLLLSRLSFPKWQFIILFIAFCLFIAQWPISAMIWMLLVVNLLMMTYLKATVGMGVLFILLRYLIPVHVAPHLDQFHLGRFEELFPQEPYAGLTPERIRQYQEEGFVVLPKVFSPKLTKQAHFLIRPIVDECEEVDCSEWGNWYYVAFIRELAVAGKDIAKTLLGEKDVRFLTDKYTKRLSNSRRFGTYWADETFHITQWMNDSLALWCPTVNVDHENIKFFKNDFRPSQCYKAKPNESIQQCRERMKNAGHILELEVGDCVAYHKRTIMSYYQVDKKDFYLESLGLYYSPPHAQFHGRQYDVHQKHTWCDHGLRWKQPIESDCFPIVETEAQMFENVKNIRLHFPVYHFRLRKLLYYYTHVHSYEFEFEVTIWLGLTVALFVLAYLEMSRRFIIDPVALEKKAA